jgi:hypothetical protein
MKPEDGGEWIKNHVNQSGVRVASPQDMAGETDFNSYRVYITGDSFIQADEVNFDQTLGHWLEQTSQRKTLQHGYSSWAPVQYMNYLKTINFKKGDDVFVFLNLTDFSPENHNSNYKWYDYDHAFKDGAMKFTLSEKDLRQNLVNAKKGHWLDRSIIWRIYEYGQKKWESMGQLPNGVSQFSVFKGWKKYKTYNDINLEVTSDCNILAKKI